MYASKSKGCEDESPMVLLTYKENLIIFDNITSFLM